MRYENRSNKIFIIIIALLLIANIGTLAMLLSGSKRTEPDHNMMRNFLRTNVGFSDDQLKAFDSIKVDYRAQAKLLFSKMQDDKQSNLKQIGSAEFNDSVLTLAAASAAADQQTVELNMLRHLRRIRELCTPQQRAVFDTGFYRVMAKAADTKKKEK